MLKIFSKEEFWTIFITHIVWVIKVTMTKVFRWCSPRCSSLKNNIKIRKKNLLAHYTFVLFFVFCQKTTFLDFLTWKKYFEILSLLQWLLQKNNLFEKNNQKSFGNQKHKIVSVYITYIIHKVIVSERYHIKK